MAQALADIKVAGCNALCAYLGNFESEIVETMLAQQFDGPKMFIAAAEENIETLSDDRGDAVTEFDESWWLSMMDYITVNSKEDIRVMFKNGIEI